MALPQLACLFLFLFVIIVAFHFRAVSVENTSVYKKNEIFLILVLSYLESASL